MAQADVKIYIGRFNPFHNGHAYVLKQALETSKLVIVLIGSSGQARSLKNPFTFEEREQMIEKWDCETDNPAGGQAHLRILPIRDYPYNDAMWIRQVQCAVKNCIAKFCADYNETVTDISITGSDRDESTWYLKAFPQWKQDLVEPYRQDGSLNVSATEIRKWLFTETDIEFQGKMARMMPESTLKFLSRFVKEKAKVYEQLVGEFDFVRQYRETWSVAPYPVTFTTVDAVVVQSGHVLVVKRGHQPGKGLWALPGGFLNQGERLRDGAIRELMEETGIRLARGNNAKEITKNILNGSIVEHEVFDHPDRSARGRTITTAYLFRLDDTKPLPPISAGSEDADSADEIADSKWITISEALERTDMWFEDHHAILETLLAGKDI